MKIYQVLADVVVTVHAAYIAVVVFGLLAILAGRVLGWAWVRHFWFRAIHLAMIAIVVVQVLLGVTCPLTTLENSLRDAAGESTYPGDFIPYWFHELIFFEAPRWVFATCYCLFGLAVAAAFVLVPPRRPRRIGPERSVGAEGGP